MSLVRVRNWDVALAKTMCALVGEPFVWGRTDCGTLCRLAVDALYGPGTANVYLGSAWSSPRTARDAEETLRGARGVLDELGAVQVHRSYASCGDFVGVPGEDDDGLPRLMWVIGSLYVRVGRVEGVTAEPLNLLAPEALVWRLP